MTMTAPVAVPSAPALTTWRRVELAKAGTWQIQVGGEQTFSGDDFAAAVAALDCPAIRRPVVKLGHLDERGAGLTPPGIENRDGEPALGWAANMATTDERQTLVADLVGMPGWLGQIAASAYPSRSIEGARNFTCSLGHLHPFVISAVALLGITPPGVGTLTSLQDHVRALYGVAASTDAPGGEPFAVTFPAKEIPVPKPVVIAAAVTVDDVRSAFYQNAPADSWICEVQLDPLQLIVQRDGGEYARVPVTVNADGSFTFGAMVNVEVMYVDEPATQVAAAAGGRPTRVRYASRAESRPADQVYAAAGDPSTDPAPAPPVAPDGDPPGYVTSPDTPEPSAPVEPAAEPEPQSTPTKEGDAMSLSEFRSRLGLPDDADEAAVLAAFDERLKPNTTPTPDSDDDAAEPVAKPADDRQLVAAAAQQEQFAAAIGQIKTLSEELAAVKAEKAAERKQAFFAAAVGQGKIAPAERESWETRYDKAPDLVTEIIGAMAVGTAVPVAAAGHTGNPEVQVSDEDLFAAFFSPEDNARLSSKEA